jgi:ketosteroid isomerase-like protein
MSQENVELVRSIYASWERGDFSTVEWAHPEIEYTIADGPTRGHWTGHAGLLEGFRHFLSAWEQLKVTATEYRELDDERILVLIRLAGRGKTSGMQLEGVQAKGADVLHVRDGKVVRFTLYFDRDHAFADLGIEE